MKKEYRTKEQQIYEEDLNIIREKQKRLIDSSELLVPYSKALSNESRYLLLIHLLSGPLTFQCLQKSISLGRTATSNHLKQLLDLGLISKPERGLYRITFDGKELLGLCLDLYGKLKVKKLNQARKIQNRYSQAYSGNLNEKETSKKQNFLVPNPALFHPSWISFVGAFTGIFQNIGAPWDWIDLGGYSGYNFLTNVAKNKLCPSAPTVFRRYVWNSMLDSLRNLGLDISMYSDETLILREKGDRTSVCDSESHLRMYKLYHWVSEKLEETHRPIIAWGLQIPEFGIINGFEGEKYICSTFRISVDLDDTPIHYESLQAPGGLWAFSFPSTPPQKWIEQSHQRDMDTIEQGLKFNYKIPAFEGYVLGPNAYEEFAKNLTAQRNSEIAYHGVSYVGECLFEQKRNLAEFLKRMASRYKNSKVNTLLINASNDFSEIADILKKFRRLFPFSLKGDFNKNDCRKGAALLRSISPFELSAFASLRTVLDIWKK